MPEKIPFIVAGCGHIGRRHAQLIQRHPEAELVGVADVNTAIHQELSELFHVPVYSSLKEALQAQPNTEVVSVCGPNSSHSPLAIEALEHKAHVIIEKPMGLSRAECEAVIHNSLQAHKHVFGVMQNRYSPPVAWLKELLTSGKLGNIYMVQINCFWNRDDRYYKPGSWKGTLQHDGGTLFTQFSHFVDVMYWLLGDISNIQARLECFAHQHNTEFEDTGTISFDFTQGGLGVFCFSTAVWDKNFESSMTIVAENGTVKLGGQYMNTVDYCHVKDYTLPLIANTDPANDYGPYKGSAANHHLVIQNVIDTLKGRTHATTNALEGMKVVEIIERVYKQR